MRAEARDALASRLALLWAEGAPALAEWTNRTEGTHAFRRALTQVMRSSVDDVARAASWVHKRLAERGVKYTAAQIRDLASTLTDSGDPATQLHLLQTLALTGLSGADLPALYTRLLELGDTPNKFVRAWSMGVLATLGDSVPHRRDDIRARLAAALRSEAKSVQARIRGVASKYDWVDVQPIRRN